ncbi:PepSY domain-containing protein [Ureibacillus sp. NPDC094379]
MTAYKKWMISLIILMLGITVSVIWTIQDRFYKDELITIQEAAKKIEDLYGGSVESFEQKGNAFYMLLERNGLSYNLQVNAKTGDLLSITKDPHSKTVIKTVEEVRSLLNAKKKGSILSIKLQENEEAPQYVVEASDQNTKKTIIVDAKTGEIVSEKVKEPNITPPSSSTVISLERAKQIALLQLNGTVQSVTFKDTSDGGYYLVFVVGSNMDATFEIHGISGKVLSVTQQLKPTNEDEDDDDGDDNSSEQENDEEDGEDDHSEDDD